MFDTNNSSSPVSSLYFVSAYDKRRSSARERQNGGAWARGNGGGNKSEQKCAKKSNIFTKFYYSLFVRNSCSRSILKITRESMKIFSKNNIFIQSSKDMDTLSRIRINSLTFDIGNKQINSESKFWILESWLF